MVHRHITMDMNCDEILKGKPENSDLGGDGGGEEPPPPSKRLCLDQDYLSDQDAIARLLQAIKNSIFSRLDIIERRLESLTDQCQSLDERIEVLSTAVRDASGSVSSDPLSPSEKTDTEEFSKDGIQFFGLSCADKSNPKESSSAVATIAAGSNLTLITLNTEADFPNGSWLGDETNPEMRVRCPIPPTKLFHINTTCTTPEKMALTLLDHLFDRETQACSNLSGSGKHKKNQLDPLMIYGIRCHLVHHFNITSSDWNRIKLNVDSKCRTAFRRKKKGLPLRSKGNAATNASESNSSLSLSSMSGMVSSDGEISDSGSTGIELVCQSTELQTFSLQSVKNDSVDAGSELTTVGPEGQVRPLQVLCTEHGDFQVLHATPEQIAQIQQTHQLQILTGGHILATPVEENSADNTSNITIFKPDDSQIN